MIDAQSATSVKNEYFGLSRTVGWGRREFGFIASQNWTTVVLA